MELKEVERKMSDYLFRMAGWIIIDIVIAFIILKNQTFNTLGLLSIIFICSIIATYDKLDGYRIMKMIKNNLIEE
jgi:hypothetical protein